jgi:hypothetical protein
VESLGWLSPALFPYLSHDCALLLDQGPRSLERSVAADYTYSAKLINWAGNPQNLAITGSAWIAMDFLRSRRTATLRLPR